MEWALIGPSMPGAKATGRPRTKTEVKAASAAVKDILLSNPDGLHEVLRAVMQEVLEAEMDEALGASKSERTPERLGYRSGYYGRTLVTRVGKLELRVPQDRAGRFSTELFERYQRSERALVATLAEMYVQGVSTRKVRAITEELCGHAFSASSISAINKRLDESLAAFARRAFKSRFLTSSLADQPWPLRNKAQNLWRAHVSQPKAACAWSGLWPSRPMKTGMEANRYINMDDLREHKKLALRQAA
ncbi:hypothetical protein X738_30250 [Mesorhizobium sp. LNHC209A00]|nr:hypothetical protein X738_30250 [Mesorhizobium sp. LNHC209A00]